MSLSPAIYIHIYIYICIYIYIHKYVNTHIRIYIYIYNALYLCIDTRFLYVYDCYKNRGLLKGLTN